MAQQFDTDAGFEESQCDVQGGEAKGEHPCDTDAGS